MVGGLGWSVGFEDGEVMNVYKIQIIEGIGIGRILNMDKMEKRG